MRIENWCGHDIREESGKIMMSVTVEGGDVDQVPLE